jgi:hypothetical protein
MRRIIPLVLILGVLCIVVFAFIYVPVQVERNYSQPSPGLTLGQRYRFAFRLFWHDGLLTTPSPGSGQSFTIAGGEVVLTNGGSPDIFKVDLGASMTKNMLRVFYKWPVMIDFMAKSMANLNDGNTLHFASITWQNEPFDD